jgi:preprotein translocase SecE subunit
MARIYKEGQGKWARGLLVIAIMLGAIFALRQLHDYMQPGTVPIPLIGFELDWRFLVHGPLLIGAAVLSYWLFNRPRTADFLIDTESELKNKVTWPSQKEEVNASIVVVVMVLILAVFIFFFDNIFQYASRLWYSKWF